MKRCHGLVAGAMALLCTLTACGGRSGTPEELAAQFLKVSGAEEQVRSSVELMGRSLEPDQAAALKGLLDPVELSKRLVPIYVKRFTPEELKKLISFYESPVGVKLREQTPALMKEAAETSTALMQERLTIVAMAATGGVGGMERELIASKQRRTMAYIRTIATSVESYAVDHELYPQGDSLAAIEAALSPTYVRELPILDAWDATMSYQVSADRNSYRIVSAGMDRVFEPGLQAPSGGRPSGATDDPARDIVYQDGEFLQHPAGLER